MKIGEFKGEYRFLSNFWYVDVEYDGHTYRSTEHAYQAAKTKDPQQQKAIREAPTTKEAKALGQKVTLREDWERVKINVMRGLLRQKFSEDPLKTQLLATGDAELEEGNSWNDRFWGVCGGVGLNWLGKLLMEVRREIQ